MLSLTLQDSTTTKKWELLEVPLTEQLNYNVIENKALSNKITRYVVGERKRKWTHTWKYLTRSEFEEILGFYTRQFENFESLRLTIEGLNGVESVPVKMEMAERSVIAYWGLIEKAEVIFEEI